jgi:signal transduction histidine kinase
MTLRTRLLLAFAAVVLVPLGLLAYGLRQEMTRRLESEYQLRVETVVEVIREDLDRESAAIGQRLTSLAGALAQDNRFRLAAVVGVETEREYLLDYAGTAMRLTGLSLLQILDGEGRILSSGHFRNEHGRVAEGLAVAFAKALGGGGVVLMTTRAPDRELLALARSQPVEIGGRTFTIVGGTVVDEAFLKRLARDPEIAVSVDAPGATLSSGGTAAEGVEAAIGDLPIPLLQAGSNPVRVGEARLRVRQPTGLRALVRSVDRWFLFTALGAGATALLLAVWVSSRISRPLADLAEKTAVLDLDRLDVSFEGGSDEVGRLSRLLGDLASRLRTSTARVREAERRATVGDLARQVNHDIKNGLIPLRNVMRHLAQVERESPEALPAVFAERRSTVDSSIAYLETLATSYQRLSPASARQDCDLNALAAEVVRAVRGHEHVELGTSLAPGLPLVQGDPVAFRRILENLTANAVDSLQSKPGRVIVSTEMVLTDLERPAVRVTVRDTGRGMSREESVLIFNDFYTTKAGGTGLGLSIVRRLVMDLHGTIAVESEPGSGTRISIDIPAAARPSTQS